MKIIIVGGTGFLGYYASLEFLGRGHQVTSLALPDIDLGDWFPKEVEVKYDNVFDMSTEELVKIFDGYDAMVYAVGPDDRVTPKAPAYEFFHERLVEACGTVVSAAREAGIRRCVVLNSYFATLHRMKPEKKLDEHHPYIRCRLEQAERVIAEGKDSMAVMVLELPYIFGTMPERVPIWKDLLFERLRNDSKIYYPKGGSNMIAVEHVAEAIVGAVEKGKHGKRYPVGDENLTWNEMLSMMLTAMNLDKKVINIPKPAAVLFGFLLRGQHHREGLESGLDPVWLMREIMTDTFFFDPSESQKELGYGSGGLQDSIHATVKACYPD